MKSYKSQSKTKDCHLGNQGGRFPPTGESVSLQPPLVAQKSKVTRELSPQSSQIRRRSPQIGAQVRHIGLDELRRDGRHVESLIGCKPVAATEGVVVVSALSACDPQHINGRDDSGVFRLLEVHRKSRLRSSVKRISTE